jgi:hypothetical protein
MHLQRWMEGELHREGPALVTPVFLRCLGAALTLALPWIVRACLSESLLNACGIAARPSTLWLDVLLGPSAFITTLLLTRPINTRGADGFGLDRDATLRAWLTVLQLPSLIFSGVMLLAILAPQNPPQPGSAPPQDQLFRIAAIIAIPSQITWTLVMRHIAAIADYLRDGVLRRVVIAWSWLLGIFLLVGLPMLCLKAWRSGQVDAWDGLAEIVILVLHGGMICGLVQSILLWWGTVHALTMAHEEVEREHRRAQREQERYTTPR